MGGNEEAARFSGLNVGRIKLRTYALAGLCAGVAGMVSLGRFGTASSSTGNGYELTVIAAAVVGGASLNGGRGSALGALLGTLVIALIENGIIILRLAQEYRLVIIGVAIIVAVSLDQLSTYLRAGPPPEPLIFVRAMAPTTSSEFNFHRHSNRCACPFLSCVSAKFSGSLRVPLPCILAGSAKRPGLLAFPSFSTSYRLAFVASSLSRCRTLPSSLASSSPPPD